MTPVVIRSDGDDCFAFYHAATGPAVLICPPLGDEAARTARVWRDLAARLRHAGVACLRFDLPGTGNSAGAAESRDRVDSWRRAVRACAEWLLERHGAVHLIGYRFGALLAIDAAAAGVPARSLVLLDPPDSGAAIARYLRARARMSQTDQDGTEPIEVGGVPLTAATMRDLGTLCPPELAPTVPSAVVANKPGRRSPWAERLRDTGSVVDEIVFEGYAEFVLEDPFRAASPDRLLDRIVAALASKQKTAQAPRVRAATTTGCVLRDGEIWETPLRFGRGGRLFGIVCHPRRPDRVARALLLPSSGMDPCYGMARMWTELARRAARNGITSLRFDMGGVGESDGDLGTDRLAAVYRPDRMDDIHDAIDALDLVGQSSVNVVAYCSGAYAAWHAALTDPRIEGILVGNLLFLNRQPELAGSVLNAPPGASRLGLSSSWTRRLPMDGLSALRRLDDGTRRFVPRSIRHFLRSWGADPQATRRHLRALLARNCAVSLVMAEDDHGHLRLRRAFGERPRLPPGAELTVIEGADHRFSDPAHRRRFLEAAEAFALRRDRLVPSTTSTPELELAT